MELPAIINVFSGTLSSPFPTRGLRTRADTLSAPTRMPISASLAPNFAKYIGRVGMKLQRPIEKKNWARKQRAKSRVKIFWFTIRDLSCTLS